MLNLYLEFTVESLLTALLFDAEKFDDRRQTTKMNKVHLEIHR